MPFNEIDGHRDKDFEPVATRALKRRLYDTPVFLTPAEKALDKRLRSHMIHSVKPYLKTKKAMTALYDYVHDDNLYPKFTAYAYGTTKKKPRGFGICQQVLHDSKFNKGTPEQLTLYRAIKMRELDKSFLEYDSVKYDDSLWYINRNVSTSITPMAALNFLDRKEPGPKCCMLVFEIPKGYPVIYLPGLFSTDYTEPEREIFLPSGEYYVEEAGWTIYTDPRKLKMVRKMGEKKFYMRVFVLRPYKKFSPFVTGPSTLYTIPYLRREEYARQMFDAPDT